MEELDKYIKESNLVFTNTINDMDFYRVGFDVNKIKVKYNNSVNLLHLVTSFNKLYLSFKKEYDELEKLDLGEKVKALRYENLKYGKDKYRILILHIDKPTITKHVDTYLFLREVNNNIKPFVTNSNNQFYSEYYRENVDLDKEVSKKYLDLFEKYELLLSTYNELKNNKIFGDGVNYIFTSIDNYDDNLLDGLNKFKFCFGNNNYHVEIPINLGDNFDIDYDNCKLILDDDEVSKDKKNYDKMLENTYINKKYIKKRNK